MSEKLNIEPRVRSLASYLSDIEKGIVQIPAFQRDYVWSRDQIKDLFDSIKNRYPIGSILFWKPNIKIGENKEKIGAFYVKENGTTDEQPIYILDGFQRLSTLFGCLTNPDKLGLRVDRKEWDNLFSLFYDLEAENFVYIRPKTTPQHYQVPVYMLMNSSEFRLFSRRELEKVGDDEKIDLYLDRADKLSRIFLDYQIASIDINNASIDEAVEIFSRVNSKGQEISKDFMANALSIKDGFRLGDEIDALLEDLRPYNFGSIKRDVIFRCIQSAFGRIYFDNVNIEELARRDDFSQRTRETLAMVKTSVQFLYGDLLVLDSKLLPYNIQLIFIVDFFKRFSNPTQEQIEILKKWFWVTTYSNYFTIYSLSNQRKAYDHFQAFLDGLVDDPVFNDKPDTQFEVSDFPDKISMGSVRAKALTLFMLNHYKLVERLDAVEIYSFKLSKLFSSSNEAENMVASIETVFGLSTVESLTSRRKPKDLSFLLDNSIDQTSIFISSEMKTWYSKDSDIKRILKERKHLIVSKESEFCNSIGLDYWITI